MAKAPDRPFWEAAYARPGCDTFGKPSEEILRLAATLPKGSAVLDIGCGEGRNALHLARAGHRVDAFDVSPAGIAKLRAEAERQGLDIRAWVGEAESFDASGPYDLVVAHGVLHLIPHEARNAVIRRMQACTREGGLNVVAVFTDALPPPDDLAPFHVGLFEPGELAGLYSRWELLEHRSYVREDEHLGGIRHRHPIEKVVARKGAAS